MDELPSWTAVAVFSTKLAGLNGLGTGEEEGSSEFRAEIGMKKGVVV